MHLFPNQEGFYHMPSGDTHEYINASDLLVYPAKELSSDIDDNVGNLGNAGMMRQPEPLFVSPMKPQQEPLPKPFFAFGISAATPPLVDFQITMQRADEVDAIQLMLNESRTSAVTLIGVPGIGKSTVAALLYQRLLLGKQQGLPSPTHMVWLTVNSYTTLPDLISAMLKGINMDEPALFRLKPEQQVSTLLRALRRSQENAFIVLDQFELLLQPEVSEGVAVTGRAALPAFLDMLQTDLGLSRILLTSYDALYSHEKADDSRVRSYLITRISLPEGIGLLQQRLVQGTPEQFSRAWQRCSGNVFSLALLSTLIHVSNTTLETFLDAPSYRAIWAGNVTINLIAMMYRYLTPTQGAILQVLSLFIVPAPLEGIIMTITGTSIGKQRGSAQAWVALEQDLLYLFQAGLVQQLYNAQNQPCYTLHSLLRSYILEHFLDNEQGQSSHDQTAINVDTSPSSHDKEALKNALATAHVQVANYYKNAIQEYCPPREHRTSPLDIEPVIGAIRHLCLSWRWQQASDLLFHEGLEESLLTWGSWNTLLGLFIGFLPPLGMLTHKDEGLVASHVAMLYGRIGEYQQSQKYFEQALNAHRAVRDYRGEAMTLTNQGEILRLHGEHKQARMNFERAMSLEKEPDDNLRCVILHNLALIAQYDNDYPQAIQCYTESLRLAVELDKQEYAGIILTNLGMTLYQNKEYREGLSLLLAALQIRGEIGDPSTSLLERFLVALEQKIGHENYAQLCQEATGMQSEVLARFMPPDVPQ
jgi:tetratricopeptide (TPR) repeat protein